ncbi:cadmium resistance transporter [Calothrix sp. PCC 6303]|uniref:cadmium resistance transporter n=1 Tax=Calothrix sp. PCC 6303 TaxID=1170562 RepID=UPI0002A0155C|nr:cadmium resistance transporter [Calothrix sp. PCC 6303]AFZ02400.1 cadmium resistance transporter [Calothrix sp. PCC 6303]
MDALASAITAFIGTNLDDIMVLILFFAREDSRTRKQHIVIGQYLGFTILVIASLPGFFGGLVIKRPIIGLLGFLPIIMGIYKLFKEDNEEEEIQLVNENVNSKINFFGNLINPQVYTVAAVTVANGADNISIYLSLFASSNWQKLVITLAVFYVMVGIWCGLGYYLTRYRFVGSVFSRYGQILTPLVLIGLGIYILFDSGTFGLMQ